MRQKRETVGAKEALWILGNPFCRDTLNTIAEKGTVDFIKLPSGHRRFYKDSIMKLGREMGVTG